MVTRQRRPAAHAPFHLGIAISAAELCVAYVGARAERSMRRVPLEPLPAEGAAWPSLARAFMELRSNPGGERLSISLLPPLAEIRVVELPPLRDDEAERVLTRNAARYFVNARHPQLVSATRAHGKIGSRVPSTVVAAATAARLVTAIQVAAHDAGFTVDAIGPAESAWVAAATSMSPSFRSGGGLVVAHPDHTDILRVDAGRLSGLRRFRPGTDDADLIAEALGARPDERGGVGSTRPQIAVFGVRRERELLTDALTSRGLAIVAPDARDPDGLGAMGGPDVLAAEYAAPSTGPVFRTDDVRAASRAAAWRTTWLVAAAAIALFVAGLGARLWGVHRQLDLVRAERARLAPRLSATLIGRTSVEGVYRNVAGLNAIERTAPSWAHAIADLTAALPDAAYLTAFRTRGDSLVVEGLAEQASDAFNAIEQIPTLANVRAGAPVRRELQDDATPLERFTIVAREVARVSGRPGGSRVSGGARP